MQIGQTGTADRPKNDLESAAGRRWEVLTAVASAFAESGYHGIGMRTIAASLGLNQGTLYHYFESKDHALLAVCLVGQKRATEDVERAIAVSPHFDARMDMLFAAHLNSLREIGPFIHSYTSLHRLVPQEIGAPLRDALHLYWAKLRQLFEDAQNRGEVDPALDPRNGMRMLGGIFHEINLVHWSGRGSELDGFAKAARAIIVQGAKPAVS